MLYKNKIINNNENTGSCYIKEIDIIKVVGQSRLEKFFKEHRDIFRSINNYFYAEIDNLQEKNKLTGQIWSAIKDLTQKANEKIKNTDSAFDRFLIFARTGEVYSSKLPPAFSYTYAESHYMNVKLTVVNGKLQIARFSEISSLKEAVFEKKELDRILYITKVIDHEKNKIAQIAKQIYDSFSNFRNFDNHEEQRKFLQVVNIAVGKKIVDFSYQLIESIIDELERSYPEKDFLKDIIVQGLKKISKAKKEAAVQSEN